ncbi:MAG: cupin domain-containing protein [Pseudomonadota bacterium]
MVKPGMACQGVDLKTGWEAVPEAAAGVEQKLLSGALDETARIGVRTRLIRFKPGTVVPSVFTHTYWEEVYLLSGRLTLGAGEAAETFAAPAYACRPPGTPHGPFSAPEGCVFFEIQYYPNEPANA